MLFLSDEEKKYWKELGEKILANKIQPDKINYDIRKSFKPIFHYYIGSMLSALGNGKLGIDWLKSGMLLEEKGLLSNDFLVSFLERQGGRMFMPTVIFQDPKPYVHFTTVPEISKARKSFIISCERSFVNYKHPLKIMDVGCGNGTMLNDLLLHLRQIDKIKDIGEILLIDPSDAMLELAKINISKNFPEKSIKTVNKRVEDFSNCIDSKYDIAVCSLSYHHMPLEKKIKHLEILKKWVDNFIIFEVDANNDIPELFSPELALSVYQIYGRIIDMVFEHDAPLDVVIPCVDLFLMSEAVSILTQPRGLRTDYHMLRLQWHDLMVNTLGADYTCLNDATNYSDEYTNIFTLHYGR